MKKLSKLRLISLIAIILILFTSGVSSLRGNSEENSGWFLENFDNYRTKGGQNDRRVQRADAIFERIKKVVDITEAPPPKLFITAYHKIAFALAIPDGGVIISSRTLDICYDGVKIEEGDRRLAFIMGHELAHLANRDYQQQKAFDNLKKMLDKEEGKDLYKFYETSSMYERGKELEADRRGALFAAMAGYNISPLLGKKNNFLCFWAKKEGDDPSHPAVETRVKAVRAQLQAVYNEVRLFRAGVLFLQMGKNTDAAAAFRKFSIFYSGREVFNNLGFCHLSSALRLLYLEFGEEYLRFRLSTAIDYTTGAADFTFRGEGDYLKNESISRDLNKAVEYLELAARKDPQDRACRYNLTAARILKREYAAAIALCDEILKRDRQDVKALNNKAAALYYLGKEENLISTHEAYKLLKNVCLLDKGNFEALYNLTALEEQVGQNKEAASYRREYLKLTTTPRDNYYAHIYEKVNKKKPPRLKKAVKLPKSPLKIGTTLKIKDSKKYTLTSEDQESEKGWTIDLKIGQKDNLFVIAIEGYVVVVEQELDRPLVSTKLLKRFGPPTRMIHHTNGTFYIYEERGFSMKEVDGEICSYAWFR